MNSYFSEQLTDRYAMNPRTGEIIDVRSGQVYNNPEELRTGSQNMSAVNPTTGKPNTGGAGMLGGLGALELGSSLTSAMSGGGAAATPVVASTAAPVATTALGGTGAFGTGGAMMSAGTYGGNMAALGGTGTGMGAGLTTVGLPVAAALAGAYGLYHGVGGITDGQRNHNDRRNAALTAINPMLNGVSEGISRATGLNNRDTTNAMLIASGMGAPLAFADMAGIKLFGTKREGERMERKDARLGMQRAGLMGPESRSIYTLPDGTNFDIREFKKSTGQDAYNIDWNAQDGKRDERVGTLNALTNAIIGGKNRRGQSAMTGELYNALMSGGDFDQNTKAIFDKMGGRDAVYSAVANNWGAKGSKMTAAERDASFAAIDKLYGVKNPNNSRWDSQLTGDLAARNQKELQKAEALKPAPASQAPPSRNAGRPAPQQSGVNAWANSLQQNKGLKDDERAAFMSGLDSIYNERSRETIRQSLGQNVSRATDLPQNKPLAPIQGKPAPSKPRTYSNPRFK